MSEDDPLTVTGVNIDEDDVCVYEIYSEEGGYRELTISGLEGDDEDVIARAFVHHKRRDRVTIRDKIVLGDEVKVVFNSD